MHFVYISKIERLRKLILLNNQTVSQSDAVYFQNILLYRRACGDLFLEREWWQ